MPDIDIVLVEPLYEGNVGFAARVMKNFGFGSLVLTAPCELGDDAYARASHARDVLENAEVTTLDEVFRRSHLTVATTGEVSKSVCTPMRMPYYTPAELRGMIADIDGRVSIIFGRENRGLENAEVRRCDLICNIPASPDYPILNLSHVVGIVCYELAHLPRGSYQLASREDMECLYQHIDHFLDLIGHQDFKRENTMILLRRLISRTNLTSREVSTLHGLMRRTAWRIKK